MVCRWLLFGVLIGLASTLSAQQTDETVIEDEGGVEILGSDAPFFRDLTGYTFGAPASTVRAMQRLAIAMQLRAYCADPEVPDAFVRDRLRRFSEMTGREETCRSLLDY